MEQLSGMASAYFPIIVDAMKAIALLFVGWIAAQAVSGMLRRRVMASQRIDNTIGTFLASIVRWAILLMVLVAVLGQFGIQATSLVAMLGAATLAVGLALQGTLSDIAAGFMIVLFRPYKLEQYVDIAGTSGTVVDINLFFTELVTPDNIQIIVPNGQAWGKIITNYSYNTKRRCDLTFGIDYGDDADKAMQIILDLARADARVLGDPEPWVRVTGLGSSSVDLTARLWCQSSDFWELKFQMTKAVKEAFDAQGITIPYPHEVQIQKQA